MIRSNSWWIRSSRATELTLPVCANNAANASAREKVRLVMVTAQSSERSGNSTPRDAPPAPINRTRNPGLINESLSRSLSKPIPSVLSPRRRPSSSRLSVFTAPARDARSVNSSARSKASSLKGTVTLAPLPPASKSIQGGNKGINRCQHPAIGMINLQLFSKLLMDQRRLAVCDRITKTA